MRDAAAFAASAADGAVPWACTRGRSRSPRLDTEP
jgi:hypothetical protein